MLEVCISNSKMNIEVIFVELLDQILLLLSVYLQLNKSNLNNDCSSSNGGSNSKARRSSNNNSSNSGTNKNNSGSKGNYEKNIDSSESEQKAAMKVSKHFDLFWIICLLSPLLFKIYFLLAITFIIFITYYALLIMYHIICTIYTIFIICYIYYT